jgi:hypothetical protein
MIKIEKTVMPSPEQWEIIIEGMRNPMNSWGKSDSHKTHIEDAETLETADYEFFLGDNDYRLMAGLAKGGAVHAKYRRMIPVFLTINAPLYWWKEFDTYKVGTVCNSCSTMHKIHAKKFTVDDFSCEHLISASISILNDTIDALNSFRKIYLDFDNLSEKGVLPKEFTCKKDVWLQLIQLLPASYNQKRTVMLNYEVLANIYHSRNNHKLDEWHTFCDWIRELPYSELITGEEKK